jgi:hypothetical protein
MKPAKQATASDYDMYKPSLKAEKAAPPAPRYHVQDFSGGENPTPPLKPLIPTRPIRTLKGTDYQGEEFERDQNTIKCMNLADKDLEFEGMTVKVQTGLGLNGGGNGIFDARDRQRRGDLVPTRACKVR